MNPFPGEFSDDEGLSRAEIRAKKRRRMMRKRRTTVIVAVCVLVFGLGGFFGLRAAGGVVDDLFGGGGDYEGNGTTEVTLEIPPGASARSVANQLVEEGVIKDSKPFLEEVERRDLTIQAGPVILREQMSSKAAVDAFINPIKPPKLTIAEGRKIDQIKATMIESGMKAEEVDKAIDDRTPKDYGLDVDAPSLEGYLYPATYDLDKAKTAEDIVSEMVAKTKLELETAGIENKDANRILTLASLVEIESPGDEETRKKVARVFLNRISEDSKTGQLLQSDATVAYIHGARADLTTTKEERNSDSPYNTYKRKGLPPGPINSPSAGAVDAALNPADGSWQFFVATNPDTGETKFADTYAEHQKNVEEYRAWLREQDG
ncbi:MULTISPECIES: endolytic transglycosylase MltG [Brevibacterium]|uniref:Endolytic murein transglycosylase n=2 Tax=Brevibacterium casei TaxID=33889 RepID=K9APK5_9MICO|nr:endolytic transglycosylase MltG [Brevibacterium casei]NJE68276.1 endolytic transglycosylase MltG [Brevibacterium sp. LS14]EKU47921.1 periplasmic solute-binding protein [Brevibacterium casei S18]KZE18158.1 ABC transporter substrate-binding protein [Brevibacterium casei]MBE4693963.1 endolytic transglycosylase MltG [Brevibacterium casei]MBY3577086.1 endolytic transglycosylase MltG [Brevibacterium casei]